MDNNQFFLVTCAGVMAAVGTLLLTAFLLAGVPGRRVVRAGIKMTGVMVFLLTGLIHAHQFVAYFFPLAAGLFFLAMRPLLDWVAGLREDVASSQSIAWYGEGNMQGILLLVMMLGGYCLLSWLEVLHF